MTIPAVPEAASSRACLRAAVGMEPVSSVTWTASPSESAEQSVAGQRAQRPADGFEMLGGEDFRGGQQGRLPAGIHHLQHGTERHDGLAGAHFALQQPVHGAVLGEFRRRGSCPTAACPAVSVNGSWRSKAASRPSGTGRRAVASSAASWARRRARADCRTSASWYRKRSRARCQSAARLRCVDQPVGLGDRQELFPGRDGGRHGVRQGVKVRGFEQGGDDLLDGPAGELGRGRIDGMGMAASFSGSCRPRMKGSSSSSWKSGLVRPSGPAIARDFAGEQRPAARQQLCLGPVAVEEADFERARDFAAVVACRRPAGGPGCRRRRRSRRR